MGSREVTGSRVNRKKKKSICLDRLRMGPERRVENLSLHPFLETVTEAAISCNENVGERAAGLTSPYPLPRDGTLEKDS